MIMPLIPKKGWFIDARGSLHDCAVYHDGQRVHDVLSVTLEIDAMKQCKIATIKLVGGEAIALFDEGKEI
jgi:hypothetical protein